MIYILLNHDRVTATQLAVRLSVSVRTVYRYIDTLSTAGVPVYVSKGRNGGVSLLPEYKMNKALVNQDEQIDILTSLKNMRDLDVESEQTLDKLAAIFQQKPVDWLKIDPTVWRKGNTQTKILAELRGAILSSKFVRFQYLNARNEVSKREVFPFQIIFKNNAWYLSGYSLERNAERLFKLTRLSHLEVVSDQHPEVTGQPWLAKQNQQPQATQQIRVRLSIDKSLKYRAYEEFPKADIVQLMTGNFEIDTFLNDGDWLITYLLSFGSGLTVVKPDSLKNKLKSEIKKMWTNY